MKYNKIQKLAIKELFETNISDHFDYDFVISNTIISSKIHCEDVEDVVICSQAAYNLHQLNLLLNQQEAQRENIPIYDNLLQFDIFKLFPDFNVIDSEELHYSSKYYNRIAEKVINLYHYFQHMVTNIRYYLDIYNDDQDLCLETMWFNGFTEIEKFLAAIDHIDNSYTIEIYSNIIENDEPLGDNKLLYSGNYINFYQTHKRRQI